MSVLRKNARVEEGETRCGRVPLFCDFRGRSEGRGLVVGGGEKGTFVVENRKGERSRNIRLATGRGGFMKSRKKKLLSFNDGHLTDK